MNDKDRSIDIQQLVNQDRHYCQSYDKCQALETNRKVLQLPHKAKPGYLSGMLKLAVGRSRKECA